MNQENGFIERIRQNGIVGCGGAGFPTYAKLKSPIRYLLINGAECEPLLHKDKEILKNFSGALVEGMARIKEYLQAEEAVLGIKEKYTDVIEILQPKLQSGMRIHPLGDFYPAGDEFVLVYETTGQVIPRGGLPLHVGAVVMNVETLLNVAEDRPVTSKFLTIAGAVNDPKTVRVPIGISFREAIELCGGASVEPYAVLTGGVMMGRLAQDLGAPVTKTTGGLLVFPVDHPLILKYQRNFKEINLIGKSACDQCSFCTELCPRYLLGHPIEPHIAMRSLVFNHETAPPVMGTLFCCECNLCTMIACPESLDPKNVCLQHKQRMRAEKIPYPEDIPHRPVHGMFDGRRTPISRLIAMLGLKQFVNKGPLTEIDIDPQEVTIPLRSHIGAAASPAVSVGDSVCVGDEIAAIDPDALCVPIHASIDGVVAAVTDTDITIKKN